MSIQVLTRGLPRHPHAQAYAALVLSGGYEEAGEAGRYRVEAGDVLIHAAFSSHRNHIDRRVEVLNLDLPALHWALAGRGRVAGPDDLVRLARSDPEAAARRVLASFVPAGGDLADTPDRLAARLRAEPLLRVEDWAREEGVRRETAFRWFRQTYGVAPSRYRVEARAREAWRRILAGAEPLAQVAAALGFSDQAHMTRDVAGLTGLTPARWRARLQHSFKTPGAPAA